MANIDLDKYLSTFLKADDLRSGPILFTIENITEEQMSDGESKIVIYSSDFPNEKSLPLNRTNLEMMISLMGTKATSEWLGRKVECYRDPSVKFMNKPVGGIALRSAKIDPTRNG